MIVDLCLALLPLFTQESKAFPELPASVFVGQAWAESRCDPKAKLETARERSAGIGQFTVAFNPDGTVRFDAAAEIRAQYRKELADFKGEGLRDPRLGIRAMVLKDRFEWHSIAGVNLAYERAAMMLSAYNGGAGGLRKDRMLCANTDGCYPFLWYGHVERTSYKSKVKWKGYGKSAFEINREYPVKIFHRAQQYRGLV